MLRLLLSVLLSLACAAFGLLFGRAVRRRRQRAGVLFKGCAGLCFVLIGLLFCGGETKDLLVVSGLFSGLCGDILLGLRRTLPKAHDRCVVLGSILFALGHALYALALLGGVPGMPLPVSLLFILLFGASLIHAECRHLDAGKLLAPAMVYLAIVAFMASCACARAWRQPEAFSLLFAAGGLCFLVSDNLHVTRSFGGRRSFGLSAALYTAYYAAQLLIAWSLYP